ncbi:MAG: catalase [Acidimicrobiaceae bacterium]
MTADADLSAQLIDGMNSTYGVHPGHRAAHAKGVLCSATFTATSAGAVLSRAAHLRGAPVRAHVRFSNGTGNPTVPDGARDGRGMAVKLYLDEGTTTDIVAVTLPAFFTRTPEDLLAFNEARRVDPETGQPDMAKVGAFLEAHPETLTAVGAAMTMPFPASYAQLTYNALHAYRFVDADGTVRPGRYHLVPDAGDASITEDEAAGRAPDYLRAELEQRFANGPIVFQLDVTLGTDDDSVDDPTEVWPESRERVRIGRLEITGLAFDREHDGDVLVFDPTRVTDGIELTGDRILLARRAAYSESVRRRT